MTPMEHLTVMTLSFIAAISIRYVAMHTHPPRAEGDPGPEDRPVSTSLMAGVFSVSILLTVHVVVQL